jgi:5'-3' exonuclease
VDAPQAPLLLVVDGNSMLHRAYWAAATGAEHAAATGRLLDASGRPVWALKGLVGYVARAAAKLRPQAVLVGFDCTEQSARRAADHLYKAQRAEKPDELREQIDAAPALIRETALAVAVPTAYEADDVLASSAVLARANGWRCVLMTSDRDAFALVDEHTSVLRVRNGGLDESVLVTAASLPKHTNGVHGWQYRDYAALRGDPSDNLPGVRGFGPATAARLLMTFPRIEDAWEAIDSGRDADVVAVVGGRAAHHLGAAEGRAAVARNRRLMRMRTDLELPALDAMRLPVRLQLMREVLARRGIRLGPSLWALTGGDPPPPPDAPAPRQPARSAAERRRPQAGQLALF